MGVWNRHFKLDWFVVIGAAFLIVFFLLLPFFVDGADIVDEPDYIVITSLDMHFTEREYHDRVLGQIEEGGFRSVCILHLLTLSAAAVETSDNNRRIYSVLLQECAIATEAFTTTGE